MVVVVVVVVVGVVVVVVVVVALLFFPRWRAPPSSESSSEPPEEPRPRKLLLLRVSRFTRAWGPAKHSAAKHGKETSKPKQAAKQSKADFYGFTLDAPSAKHQNGAHCRCRVAAVNTAVGRWLLTGVPGVPPPLAEAAEEESRRSSMKTRSSTPSWSPEGLKA